MYRVLYSVYWQYRWRSSASHMQLTSRQPGMARPRPPVAMAITIANAIKQLLLQRIFINIWCSLAPRFAANVRWATTCPWCAMMNAKGNKQIIIYFAAQLFKVGRARFNHQRSLRSVIRQARARSTHTAGKIKSKVTDPRWAHRGIYEFGRRADMHARTHAIFTTACARRVKSDVAAIATAILYTQTFSLADLPLPRAYPVRHFFVASAAIAAGSIASRAIANQPSPARPTPPPAPLLSYAQSVSQLVV